MGKCQSSCNSCRKQYCIDACYNKTCTSRIKISEWASLGCCNAHECRGFISRKTYLKQKTINEKRKERYGKLSKPC